MPTRHQLANAIRALAMDAVQQANSGHPGMPMGMADIAQVLFADFLKFNPGNPNWYNRDRFVLSNGHGAMLLYAVLHLTGYDLSIEDIKQFRQLHSKTPGHPEHGDTPGVETTTGPLGQGLANAVGMAIAEQMLAAEFNRDGHTIVDHYTYVFAGDGCLMEGISHEACSLAGTFGLGKLIVIYDDNGISIDGDVTGWFTDDTPKRFAAYHWHVISSVDGHDPEAIAQALTQARSETAKPTIICMKTKIGYGAPTKVGTASTHGAPLGESEVAGARAELGWNYSPFDIPPEIKQIWNASERGRVAEDHWNKQFSQYESAYPELAAEFLRRMQGWLPPSWDERSQNFIEKAQQTQKSMATRKAQLSCLNEYASQLPEFIGGSADLTESNCTLWQGATLFNSENKLGRYIEFGVREFAMSAIMNGIALHGGFIPFGGTFLTFCDYARNAVRLSALMQQKVIFVYTHDSIGLGEDGPTHQPIEHAAMLRMTPGMRVWRPCDLAETAVAWKSAIEHQGPSSLLLTRQNTEAQPRTELMLHSIQRGGYILYDNGGALDGIFIATGSEVELAMQAAQALKEEGLNIRVVSMPCAEIFKAQETNYHEEVLPSSVAARVAIEAAVPDYWYQFVGLSGKVIGIERFGASAPAKEVFAAYGFTVPAIKNTMQSLVTQLGELA